MKNGTEKQISWAKEIKKSMLENPYKSIALELKKATQYIDNKKEKIESGCGTEKTEKYLKNGLVRLGKIQAAFDLVENCEDAIWFIENKNFVSIVEQY